MNIANVEARFAGWLTAAGLGGNVTFVASRELTQSLTKKLLGSSNPHLAGLISQLHSVLTQATSPKDLNKGVRRIITKTALPGEATTSELFAWVNAQIEMGESSVAGLEKYKADASKPAGLTYRYMLKSLSLSQLALLAISMSSVSISGRILAARALSDGWRAADQVYGLPSVHGVVELCKEFLAAHPNAALGDWPEGPYPNGYVADSVEEDESDEPTTTTTAPAKTAIAQGVHKMIDPNSLNSQIKTIADSVLANTGLGMTIDDIVKAVNEKALMATQLADLTSQMAEQRESFAVQINSAKAAASTGTISAPVGGGARPSGAVKMVQASTIWPVLKGLKLEVPFFDWAHAHPDVPAKIDGYIFRKGMLVRALRSLARRENLWLVGHTGSGKTTFAEQIAAHLNWPTVRIAFDSSIERAELLGRMNLSGDGKGGTISTWLAGLLEYALPNNYMVICDEVDHARVDSLYTLQPVFERNPLRLLEDGGRLVPFSTWTVNVATGNTAGNGDPSGLYPAARILSAATLDRMPEFIHVPYISMDEEQSLIKRDAPSMAAGMVQKVSKFANEMRIAFTKGEFPISYSPRRSIAFSRAVEDYLQMGLKEPHALGLALKGKVLEATPEEFRQRITELAGNNLGAIDLTAEI